MGGTLGPPPIITKVNSPIFHGESKICGFGGVQGHLEGPGERRDQHGHGLGLGVDYFLVYTFNTCF